MGEYSRCVGARERYDDFGNLVRTTKVCPLIMIVTAIQGSNDKKSQDCKEIFCALWNWEKSCCSLNKSISEMVSK